MGEIWVSGCPACHRQSVCVLLSPGAPSEDPQFPKVQWPPRELCSACHNELRGTPVWDLDNILKFLKTHFSPSNIVLDFPSAGPGPWRGAERMAVIPKQVELELATGNVTLAPEKAEIPVGSGIKAPGGTIPVAGLGARCRLALVRPQTSQTRELLST